MKKKWIIALLLLPCIFAYGQEEGEDTLSSHVHMSLGTTVFSVDRHTDALVWAAPSVDFKPTDRLTLRGGFMAAGSLMPSGGELRGWGERSMAPLKRRTKMGGMWASAEYRATEQLSMWVALGHVGGYLQMPMMEEGFNINATTLSGGFCYEYKKGCSIGMSFDMVYDRGGGLLGATEMYGYHRMGMMYSEFGPFGGGWYY